MKRFLLRIFVLLLAFSALSLGSCHRKNGDDAREKDNNSLQKQPNLEQNTASKPGNTYMQIAQQEAKRIIDFVEGILILDVRTEEEFAQEHIAGAICVPVETIGAAPPAALPDKAQKILVYCRSGRRSKIAAQALCDLGYTDVLEFGGILTRPYETVRP